VQHRSTFSIFPHGSFTTFPRTSQPQVDDFLEPDDEAESSTSHALSQIPLSPLLRHRSSDDSIMDSVLSVLSGSPGQVQPQLPATPFLTASMTSDSSQGGRQLRLPRGRRRHHSSKSRSKSKDAATSRMILPSNPSQSSPPGPLSDQSAPSISQHDQIALPSVLAPLPLGDPVLPQVLQAVPYPTVQDVRPPLGPVLQYQAVGQILPPISQLIEASLEFDTADAAHQHAKSNKDHEMIDEGFDEASVGSCDNGYCGDHDLTVSSHNGHLQSGFGRDQHHTTQHEPAERRDGGLRLGLMRFYRDHPVPEPTCIVQASTTEVDNEPLHGDWSMAIE
jgi:hypothetical protein